MQLNWNVLTVSNDHSVRGFSRMLIAVVMMFAVCNLPQQARILWRHWDSSYDRTSDFSTLLTLSTFLISYTNSCMNPLLYAFLSRNFRKGIQELLFCKGSRRRAVSLAMGYTRDTQTRQENGANQPHSSIVRLSSVRDSPRRSGTITRQITCEKISWSELLADNRADGPLKDCAETELT